MFLVRRNCGGIDSNELPSCFVIVYKQSLLFSSIKFSSLLQKQHKLNQNNGSEISCKFISLKN